MNIKENMKEINALEKVIGYKNEEIRNLKTQLFNSELISKCLECCGNCGNFGQGTAMSCKKDFDCNLFCKDDLINHWTPMDSVVLELRRLQSENSK